MDDSATGHTTYCSITALDDILTKWFITHRMWFVWTIHIRRELSQ